MVVKEWGQPFTLEERPDPQPGPGEALMKVRAAGVGLTLVTMRTGIFGGEAPRIMGHQRAFELLAMGAKWSADEAQGAGLVNKVTDSNSIEQEAYAIAGALAAKPPEALSISRKLIRGDRSDVLARMKEEAVLFGERLTSEEAKTAFMAFMSKGQKKAS